MNLTLMQRVVVRSIADATAELGMPPTIRELGRCCGIKWQNAQDHVRRLKRKGAVTWEPNRARTLRVTDEAIAEVRRHSRPRSPGLFFAVERRRCGHAVPAGVPCGMCALEGNHAA